jgi:hypothetical protein
MSDGDPDRTGSASTSAATLVSNDFPIVGGRPACLTAIPTMGLLRELEPVAEQLLNPHPSMAQV